MGIPRQARDGLLILGGGFAGGYVARLASTGSTVVSLENYMLYTPMLPEAASGTLEPRHVVVPLRQMCRRSELLLGHVTGHDEERRTVAVDTEAGAFDVEYEQLVVALGSVHRVLPVPGLAEHAYGFKDLPDAIRLRNHVLRELEYADAALDEEEQRKHLSFVFIGAGYAGVEALAELRDLVEAALRYYPRLRPVPRRWVLVDAAPKILPEIPRRLGEYADRYLTKLGVEIHVGTTLSSLEAETAHLSNDLAIPTKTLVWTAGVRPNGLAPVLGLPTTEKGGVAVDETLRVEGKERIWALGDCARVPNQATPGEFDPPTCQHALRQARRLAKNLRGDPQPYRYRMLGQVATLGHYKGIADVLGLHFRGFLGWFVTRTYHLYQLPLLSRKLRVVTDWTVALFFRRDLAELAGLGRRRGLGDG
jgi:NADH:ubiquinone reductase (H+-translocating)